MRTVTTSAHILDIAQRILRERGVEELSAEQGQAVSEAVDRWYAIPLDPPTAEDIVSYYRKRAR